MSAKLTADPLASLRGEKRAYVVEPWKILYISTAKNACTTLKWLVAELAGEDLSRFRAGTSLLLTEDEAIHQRDLYQRTPKLNQVDPELRRSIDPANGWFVFSVVRDPRSRVFSAWQNKLLLHNPNPSFRRWRHEPWYPQPPQSLEDIYAGFAAFAELMDKQPDHPVFHDNHLLPQTRLLHLDAVPYSKIYEISELGTMFTADITAHLRNQGWDGEIALRQANDTPLRANRHVFAEPVRAQVERFYADDFAAFGDRWDFGKIENAPEWPAATLGNIRMQTMLIERIGELVREVRRANRRAARGRS